MRIRKTSLLWLQFDDVTVKTRYRKFPSSSGPLFQNEVKWSAFDMEMTFHSHANKLSFTRKVDHLASFWKWGFRWNSQVAYYKNTYLPFFFWVIIVYNSFIHTHNTITPFGCCYCCFVWVCMWQREREREREGGRGREREKERVFFWECTCRYFVKYNSLWVMSF